MNTQKEVKSIKSLTGGKKDFIKALNSTDRQFCYIEYKHGEGWTTNFERIKRYWEGGGGIIYSDPERFQYHAHGMRGSDYSDLRRGILEKLNDLANEEEE